MHRRGDRRRRHGRPHADHGRASRPAGIGGPSAGLAFALEIYDSLSGRHLLDGHKIAVTGELDLGGGVHAIGGVKQKTVGAIDAGADTFIVPRGDNARDAQAAADGRIRVIGVKVSRRRCRSSARCRHGDDPVKSICRKQRVFSFGNTGSSTRGDRRLRAPSSSSTERVHVAQKARCVTCNDCFFRKTSLCALDLSEPCPTFRPAVRGQMVGAAPAAAG